MADPRVWTVHEALAWTREFLTSKGDASPRTSAEWLLSAATGLSRLELYTQGSKPLSHEERVSLREGVRRRAGGEPLQYVTGEMPFRHLVVLVEPGVLIPRPETEVLVDEALRAVADTDAPLVLDLCTGTGCVALSLAHETSAVQIWACDISPQACACARANAERLGLGDRLQVVESDLFAKLPGEMRERFDVVVANPPYVPTGEVASLPAEVGRFEPMLALDGGADGLALARRIWREAPQWLKAGGALVLELDERKVRAAVEEIVEWYEQVRVVPDLTGRDRVLVASAPSAGPGSTVEGGNGDVKDLPR